LKHNQQVRHGDDSRVPVAADSALRGCPIMTIPQQTSFSPSDMFAQAESFRTLAQLERMTRLCLTKERVDA
jgi:hypothetical protein